MKKIRNSYKPAKAYPADDGEVRIFKEMALFVQMFL